MGGVHVPSNERAVVGILRGTFPEGRLTEGQERARPNGPPPIVRLVFPRRLDANPCE